MKCIYSLVIPAIQLTAVIYSALPLPKAAIDAISSRLKMLFHEVLLFYQQSLYIVPYFYKLWRIIPIIPVAALKERS
jgi:hypothetical protein